MIDEAVELYAVDPSGFVAARTQLVRELKAAKRKDDAAVVAKLPRPRLGEHLLNLVARHQPDVASAFAAAVGAATAAQSTAIGSGEGAALRASSAELRSATTALVDAAVRELQGDARDAPGRRDEVLTIVRGLTNESGVAQLLAGVVGSGTEVAELDLFAGAPEPRDVPKRAAKAPRSKSQPSPAKEPAAATTRARRAEPEPPVQPTKAEQAAARRHQAQLERATTTLQRAEREVGVAQRALAAATTRLAAAEAARDQAAADLADLTATP